MASKHAKLQQRNKHPRAAPKILAPPSQKRSSDPWSFLECIDAPQWMDFSLEESSMRTDGFDSWFDRSHKHHVKSLAGMNTNMSWLCVAKSSQGKGPILTQGWQKEFNKPEKKQSAGHLSKLGTGQSQSEGQVTGLRVLKGAQDSNNTERGCNARRPYGSLEMGCSFSSHSSTSDCEPSVFLKKHSLCSDRSSVSSSLQACSVEMKKFSSVVQRGSSNASQSEDFHDTPTNSSGGAQKSRNSSSASYCAPMVKSRFSSEVRVSTRTKLSEFWVSTATKSQFVCEADHQSSGDSVVTSVSGTSNTSEEQVDKGCARTWEEGIDGLRKISELKFDVEYNQPLTGGFIADSNTSNKSLSCCEQMANEAVKSRTKSGRQRLEMRVSQVGSLPRKQLYLGKENAPPKESLAEANMLPVKDKPFHSKAPLSFANSKTANARTVGLSSNGGFRASQVSKKEGLQRASQVKPWKSGVSQNLNNSRASSIAHQRKRSEAKQLPVVCEKTSKSERDLAALVAQHNQKIRSLQMQNCRKGLR